MLPEFDTSKFYLSVLCKKGHDWEGTGQSLMYLSSVGSCVECAKTSAKERYERSIPPEKRKEKISKERSRELLESHGVDTEKLYLGKLCKRSHDWNNTGFTLRYVKGSICPECKRLTGRLWEKQNPEAVREMGRRKRAKNPDRYKNYYHRNLEKERARGIRKYHRYKPRNQARMRKWYEENRDLVIERSRDYQQTPIGKMVRKGIHNRRRAAILRTRAIPYTPNELQQHFEKFGNECVYCGNPDRISVDHFIPLVKGGSDCLGNLVPCCRSCNTSKNVNDALEWYQRQSFYDRKRWKKILEILGKDDPNQLPLF